jgi:hypothetical protein
MMPRRVECRAVRKLLLQAGEFQSRPRPWMLTRAQIVWRRERGAGGPEKKGRMGICSVSCGRDLEIQSTNIWLPTGCWFGSSESW